MNITDIYEMKDSNGKRYLQAIGTHCYDATSLNGTNHKAFNNFTAIQLLGSEELLDETIRRFDEAGIMGLDLVLKDTELYTRYKMSTFKSRAVITLLVVYLYDFVEDPIDADYTISRLMQEEQWNEEN